MRSESRTFLKESIVCSLVLGLGTLVFVVLPGPKPKTQDQRPLQCKKPRAKQRDFKIRLNFFGLFFHAPYLFSCLFYVAASRLNSPRHRCLYAAEAAAVKFSMSFISFQERGKVRTRPS